MHFGCRGFFRFLDLGFRSLDLLGFWSLDLCFSFWIWGIVFCFEFLDFWICDFGFGVWDFTCISRSINFNPGPQLFDLFRHICEDPFRFSLFQEEQPPTGSAQELHGGDTVAGSARVHEGYELGDHEGYVKESFVKAVVADESLNMNEAEAERVFTYMVKKVKDLGLKLLPAEMLEQLGWHKGLDYSRDDDEEPMEEPALPSASSRLEEVEDLEQQYEDWDSSFPSTQGPGSPWTSGDEMFGKQVSPGSTS